MNQARQPPRLHGVRTMRQFLDHMFLGWSLRRVLGRRGCGLGHAISSFVDAGVTLSGAANYSDAFVRAFIARNSPEISRRPSIASAT
jgi:hypothetical protein